MDLTLQLHHGGAWHDAATLTIERPDLGLNGPSRVAYELAYFVEHGAIALADGTPLRDARAMSVAFPLTMEDRSYPTLPPFLLDLMPQGYQREKIANLLGIKPNVPASEIPLLMRVAGSPVGNMRIKEAHLEEVERLAGTRTAGVKMEDILRRGANFLEAADAFATIASGSSGLQGEWPKIAMTQARDGLWYPGSTVSDRDAVAHVIVKILRSNDESDALILAAEAPYAAIAREFGLTVAGTAVHENGVLVVPRFDRTDVGGRLVRYGQESIVSALGVAEFGHVDTHENYLAVIRAVSSDPLHDVAEYVLRDVLNQAMGNPDNHGRNTALRKTADGDIRLSPLYDFAPMVMARGVVVRSTRWDCMRASGRDHAPDWKVVCEAAAGDTLAAGDIMDVLVAKEDMLRALPDIAARHGVPRDVATKALVGCAEIADGIAALRSHRPKPGGR